MENARNERRLLNEGKDYGRALGIKMAKRTKTRPNLERSRTKAVRTRQVEIAGGTSSLNKGQLGLEELPLIPSAAVVTGVTSSNTGGRILNQTELWELLQFISRENKEKEKTIRRPPSPPETHFTVDIVEGDVATNADVDQPANSKKRKRKPKIKKLTEINLANWTSVNTGGLRSLALSLGDSLVKVTMRGCENLTNEMLESFCGRLYVLESFNLSRCPLVGDVGARILSDFCGGTLISLDLSDCPKVGNDSCGWISGQLGHNRPGCRKLQSLDLSNVESIDDVGLTFLGRGCAKLKFLSLYNNQRVTDKGIANLAKGCKHLRVLNVSGCELLNDMSLISISKYCKNFLSLNASRCGVISDKGLLALSTGCRKLQALNLANAKKITEGGLCEIAKGCPGLQTINVGGCENITRNGLLALIEGLGYVEEAKTFFGFVPIGSATDLKLLDQQFIIENNSARVLQNCYHQLLQRRASKAMVKFLREDKAALEIQLWFQRAMKLREHRRKRLIIEQNKKVVELQRVIRGYWGRLVAAELKEYWDELKMNARYAVLVQAKARGHRARRHDRIVKPALVVFRQERQMQFKMNAAILLQKTVRGKLSRLRVHGWSEVVQQRRTDISIQIIVLQCSVRCCIARMRLTKKRYQAYLLHRMRTKAAIRMQNLYRISEGKYGGMMRKEQIERVNRLKNRSCLRVQAVFRGFLGREEMRAAKYELNLEMEAALMIQRVYRATRIMHWSDIKMNKVAAYVFKRQQLELQERQRCADIRNAQRLEGAQHDSASEDETVVDVHDLWQERFDEEKKVPYWYNPSLQTTTYERPLNYAFERSLIGLKVRVFWVLNNEFFTGKITKYNKSKKRWRVNYADGDHEWIDFNEEHERIQIYADNSWKMFKMFRPEVLGVIENKKEEKKKLTAECELKKERAESWELLGWDEENERNRYHSLLLDEVRLSTEANNFEEWTIKQDEGEAEWYYYNTVTDKRVPWDSDDPRLDPAEDSEVMKLFKIQLISDLRFGAYFCRALLQEYLDCWGDEKAVGKVLERIRTEDVCKKMAISIVNAQRIWEEKEFNAIDELVEAVHIQKEITKLLSDADRKHWKDVENKKRFLSMGKNKKVRICPKCNYEVEDASATFCEVCGFKLGGRRASTNTNMTEEERKEALILSHRSTKGLVQKTRATMRATRTFTRNSMKKAMEVDMANLDLDADDDAELGLKDSNEDVNPDGDAAAVDAVIEKAARARQTRKLSVTQMGEGEEGEES